MTAVQVQPVAVTPRDKAKRAAMIASAVHEAGHAAAAPPHAATRPSRPARRTTLTVRMPRTLASRIRYWPTAELAAF